MLHAHTPRQIIRLASFEGMVLIGCPSSVWRDTYYPQLQAAEEEGLLELLSVQTTEMREAKCVYYMALVKGLV